MLSAHGPAYRLWADICPTFLATGAPTPVSLGPEVGRQPAAVTLALTSVALVVAHGSALSPIRLLWLAGFFCTTRGPGLLLLLCPPRLLQPVLLLVGLGSSQLALGRLQLRHQCSQLGSVGGGPGSVGRRLLPRAASTSAASSCW